MKAATGVIKTALALHRKHDATMDTWFGQVRALMDLRHRLAHGTTESWRANPPEVRNGRLAWRSALGHDPASRCSSGSTSRKRRKLSLLGAMPLRHYHGC
jgi:hypothetical protein